MIQGSQQAIELSCCGVVFCGLGANLCTVERQLLPARLYFIRIAWLRRWHAAVLFLTLRYRRNNHTQHPSEEGLLRAHP